MKNLTDSSFVYLGHWPSAGSFGFNTDILATPINLSVVFGVLIFFGKETFLLNNLLSLNDLLDNRKQRILNTIRKFRRTT
uniref:ATP synthase CF0 subunit I n=1 Tax=Brassica oleracea TaxID=3712 RepID=A0A3P6GYS9_BRAOL|nr:unnamed protein product [Brassica oleracea]